jgi:hypothetical protein
VTAVLGQYCHTDEGKNYVIIFMVTPCINDIKHFYCPTNAHNVKKHGVIKAFLKQRRLLQCVLVYNETIIREPQPVLGKTYTHGSAWIHVGRTDVVSVMAA